MRWADAAAVAAMKEKKLIDPAGVPLGKALRAGGSAVAVPRGSLLVLVSEDARAAVAGALAPAAAAATAVMRIGGPEARDWNAVGLADLQASSCEGMLAVFDATAVAAPLPGAAAVMGSILSLGGTVVVVVSDLGHLATAFTPEDERLVLDRAAAFGFAPPLPGEAVEGLCDRIGMVEEAARAGLVKWLGRLPAGHAAWVLTGAEAHPLLVVGKVVGTVAGGLMTVVVAASLLYVLSVAAVLAVGPTWLGWANLAVVLPAGLMVGLARLGLLSAGLRQLSAGFGAVLTLAAGPAALVNALLVLLAG
jgi:hypothetical protein